MKNWKFVSMVLFGIFSFSFCNEKKEEDPTALLLATLQYESETKYLAVIEIRIRDVGSYEGRCFDTFIGLTANAYYEMHYPEYMRNLPDRKSIRSELTCSRLGFSGGVVNRPEGNTISFRNYSCSPLTSLCAKQAIEAVGF